VIHPLTAFALKHPVTVLMLMVCIVALGVIACDRMPLKFLPDLDFPFIGCWIPYAGATPEQVEKEVARPAEGHFRTIPNLKRISTSSSSNGCHVGMRFENGTNMPLASAEVRDRLERLKLDLPEDVDRAFLYRHSSDAIPIMAFGFFRAGDEEEFCHLLQIVMKPKLARIEGVAEVQVMTSKPEQEVLIEFDQNRLRSHNIGLYQVVANLQASNLNVSVGEILEGETRCFTRVLDPITSPKEMGNLVIGPNALRLKEVARVGFRPRETNAHYDIDDKGGAFVIVLKESEANTVETCRAVRDEIQRMKADPVFEGAQEYIFFDQSALILTALKGLMMAGMLGGIMAIIVLFFFLLRIRPTIIVALAIPTSLLTALVYIFFSGLTLNLVTISSLIVGLGMLVDNAIVVIENIYRHKEMGDDPMESAARGASEVGVAITAATLTTVVVFIPVIYMEQGEMARYMAQFAGPMVVSLFASLFVALTLIPLAISRMRDEPKHSPASLFAFFRKSSVTRENAPTESWHTRAFRFHPVTWIIRAYTRCLDLALRNRVATVTLVVLVIVLTYMVPYRRVELQEMPTLDLREVDVQVKLDQNYDLAMATNVFELLKGSINELREELAVDNLFTRYSPSGGIIEVHLIKTEDFPAGEVPPYSTEEALDILSEKLPELAPGAELEFGTPEAGTQGEMARTISVRMRGDEAKQLEKFANRLKTLMEDVPNLSDVSVNTQRAEQEMQIHIDEPRAEQAGISPFIVARTVDMALRGTRLPYMKQKGREYPVWAQFREEDRKSRANLDNVAVIGKTGALVPLNQLVSFGKAESPASIYRVDGKNELRVSAKVGSEGLTLIQRDLEKIIASFELPLGYSIDLGDTFVELETTFANYLTTLAMAIILIYIVMSALFESMVLPLSILTTVPLAFIGVYWAMYITRTSLDTIGLIGCILMVGVVVNNGIVIVDHINFLRLSGVDRRAAVLQGGRDRFRPVMMTALTTILGCVPLAIKTSASTISFLSLGRALIGGLSTGTILTLVIVPLLYTIIDDAREGVLGYFASVASLGRRAEDLPTRTPTASP